ncbi:UDP-glucuronic acid decarboxylase family protein [Rhodococcus sp. MSC1_016]|jgi:dTDP-glucose 4,6-dehydratase|uniref:UDP-glucuronic acid decarboxylase family protein n=1 Tax=Rhodococcus sp. MSC1_016 TaxID=2909266 RepID=UPI00202E2853|nr:UDP-glucuronic acid decarboxylase family protein [Rhodococcus sp. MSC1_016]
MTRFERALVTGGAGFVGSHLCEELVRSGTAVCCMDNGSTGTPANVQALRDSPLFEYVDHDVSEPFPDVGSVDVVFHLASPASPVDYQRLPVQTLLAGSHGTKNGLDLAVAQGGRFLLASTSEVYGDPLEHPQRESYWGNVNPVGPRSVYDEAKRYAEALCAAYGRAGLCDIAIARIFNTYGPRMRDADGRMIPTFLGQALRGEPITVAGTGRQTRSICFVTDTVAGLCALAESRERGPVNIGNPDEMTVLSVAERILDLTGSRSPIVHIPAAQDDPQQRCPDIARARSALGWAPRVGADEGLRRTVRWVTERSAAA